MTRIRTTALLGTAIALCITGLSQRAGAQGMPLDHVEYYFQPGAKMDPMYTATRTDRMREAERYMSTFRSRVEAEGKVEIARKDLGKAQSQLDKLANDSKLAARVLGKGWRVVKVGNWQFSDVYRDNRTFDLAKGGSGFRVRVVNGGKAEINVKPPGGRKSELQGDAIVDTPSGTVTRRVEFGSSMHARASLKAIAASASKLNPLGWIPKMMKQQPGEFIAPAMNIDQDRVRYVLQKHEGKDAQGKDQWNPLVDVSVDDIKATVARGPKANRRSVKFASIEFDLNHPGSGSGLVISTGKWSPPHKPSDLRRPEFMRDEAVRDLHTQVPKLLSFIDVKAESAAPKYTAACVKLGLIPKQQVRARKVLSAAEQTSVMKFVKSRGWTTNAQAKVIGQSRSGNSWRVLVSNTNGGGTRKLFLNKKTSEVFDAPKAQAQRNSLLGRNVPLTFAGRQVGRRNSDWTRGGRTITVDTRGINAGTREGQQALRAASSLFRDSAVLGSRTSAGQAQGFNHRAVEVARQVNSVAAAHRSQSAERARSDRFVRGLISSRSR